MKCANMRLIEFDTLPFSIAQLLKVGGCKLHKKEELADCI